MVDNIEKYFCPKHGENGNPDCSICWENLEKLLSDMNVYQSGENQLNPVKTKGENG